MKVAVDTNILAYVEGINGGGRQLAAIDVIERIPQEFRLLPVQALGELYNVLVRKARWSPSRARAAVTAWRSGFEVAPTTASAITAAIDVATDHRLTIWDSAMLAVAAENDCRLLLSEDFQDGFTWGGVTVANPFAAKRHPLLEALLAG
jgi:predicted nucleic acid-binding protein